MTKKWFQMLGEGELPSDYSPMEITVKKDNEEFRAVTLLKRVGVSDTHYVRSDGVLFLKSSEGRMESYAKVGRGDNPFERLNRELIERRMSELSDFLGGQKYLPESRQNFYLKK